MNKKLTIVFIVVIIITSLSLMGCVSLQERSGIYRNHDPQFTIKTLVIAKDVKNRKPVGVSDTFSSSIGKVYCFIMATDIAQDSEIIVTWYFEEKKIYTFTLPLKQGNRWRTFSYKDVSHKKGNWRVVIRDSDSYIYKSASFTVK
jgi:hypothetical protein